MAEIVFPCQCGLLLKVHGNDQVGQGIVCPSCGSTVVVPAAGIVVDEPAPLVASGATAPATTGSASKWFGLAYLGGISVVTLGLIKFVLMPALSPPAAPPVVVAQADSSHDDEPADQADDAEPDDDDAPRRLLKRPAGAARTGTADSGAASPTARAKARSSVPAPGSTSGGRPGRGGARKRAVPAAPAGATASADESGSLPSGPFGRGTPAPRGGMMGGLGGMPTGFPGGMGRGPGGLPTGPRGGFGRGLGGSPPPPRGGFGMFGPAADTDDDRPAPAKPAPTPKSAGPDTGGPAKATRLSKGDVKAKTAKKPAARKAVYAHIDNKEARLALENAAKNTTDILATFAAENFLRLAETVSEGDPKVTAEIKKLRRKIAEVRNEPPPPP